MKRLKPLGGDARGATLVEFALALPILILFMIGTVQFGLVLHASGGMRHALGEGIRFARVDRPATTKEIEQRVRDSLTGIDPSFVTQLTAARSTNASGADVATVSMRYRVEWMIPFLSLPPIVLNQSKTTYLPS